MRKPTTTKKRLMDRVASQTGLLRADVKAIIHCFLDSMIDDLQRGMRVEFRDFGVFDVHYRGPRLAQNPKTMQRVPISGRRIVKFKASRRLKDAVNRRARPAAAASRSNLVGAAIEVFPPASERVGAHRAEGTPSPQR